jgi:glycosyltransferase involved in cell wall biosynthesis
MIPSRNSRSDRVSASDSPQRSEYGGTTLSVIIPHYNDLANLQRCLELLDIQTEPRDNFEIIVADNNSPCGLAAVAAVCGEMARIVPAPIRGAGPARNVGAAHAIGRYLAFIDSDCRADREWVARGIGALEGGDMVGGHVEVVVDDPRNPTATEAFELVFAFNNQKYVEKKGFSITGNMFVRKEVFEAVGDFRAKVAEDVDWGRRAVAQGYRWRYAPEVRISHPARRDWSELTRKWRRLIEESFLATKEKRFGAIFWIGRSWLVALSTPIFCPAVFLSPRLQRVEDRVAAIGILFRLRGWRLIESHLAPLKYQ